MTGMGEAALTLGMTLTRYRGQGALTITQASTLDLILRVTLKAPLLGVRRAFRNRLEKCTTYGGG